MVVVLQSFVAVVVAVMLVYGIRHWAFTFSRMMTRQRPFFQDLFESDLPGITVVVPMHNEGAVASGVLDALIDSDYPHDRLEIFPIDDQSRDDTSTIILGYSQRYPFIKPVYRLEGERGKPSALNLAMHLATKDVVMVFDADYTPSRGLLRELAMAFVDPEVGAVMGRVVPRNTSTNLLTRLLSLERSGGYQVDQQARFNLDLLPQYGGTVGGFRRSVVERLGGFDPEMLAEDTDLTLRLFIAGWTVAYANRAECYEEVPDTWEARYHQLRRWSRGHTRALLVNLLPLLRSPHLKAIQKLDGALLLGVYAVAPLLLLAFAANVSLFLMGALPIWSTLILTFFVVMYNSFGNFAPVYEIGAAEVLDGSNERIYLLPYLFYLFIFNTVAVTAGLMDTIGDVLKRRSPVWKKTRRSADQGA